MNDKEYLDYRSSGMSLFSSLYFLAFGGGIMMVFGTTKLISMILSCTLLILAGISELRRFVFFAKNRRFMPLPKLILETIAYFALMAGAIVVGCYTVFAEKYFDYYWLVVLAICTGFIGIVMLYLSDAKVPTEQWIERNKYNPPYESTEDIF